MAAQSLYRRYRPRSFGQVRGQDHVVSALRNAVRSGTEGHAYLFSGPRGTGKTTTARILAKALNCEHLDDGEPCGECQSCLDVDAGRSFDLFELDAASNNGVDAIRSLIERAAVGSPGRTKVYILDEVHMLSAPASNALLKTLEEPPEHVCFVLATTDPQKVLPTIRSRTQHFEFQLLSADELTEYVRWIVGDAGLDVGEDAIAHVVRQGHGSARDTLSALDQVVAAGGVVVRAEPVAELFDALAARDCGAAVAAVADALNQGSDPRVLAESFLAAARNAFLTSVAVEVTHLVDADRTEAADRAERLGTATLTRAMETVGAALVDMRNAADPRVPLEVALIRLTSPSDDAALDLQALTRRVEVLEKAVSAGVAGAAADASPAAVPAASQGPVPSATAESAPSASPESAPTASPEAAAKAGPDAARAALRSGRESSRGSARAKDKRSVRPAPPGPAPGTHPTAVTPPPVPPSQATDPAPDVASHMSVEPSAAGTGVAPADGTALGERSPGLPDRDELVLAFGDSVMPKLRGLAKAIYSNGRFVSVDDRGAVFALENEVTLQRAEKYRAEVEAALESHFGRRVPLVLTDLLGAEDHPAPAPASPAAPVPATAPNPGSRPRDRRDRAETTAPASDGDDDPAGAPASAGAANGPIFARARAGDSVAAGEPLGIEEEDLHTIDLDELEDAVDVAVSGLEKLTKAFPGAVLIEEEA